MREVTLTITCDCGFRVQRMFRANEHGYFEIPDAYCPYCFHLLIWSAQDLPMDIVESGKQWNG